MQSPDCRKLQSNERTSQLNQYFQFGSIQGMIITLGVVWWGMEGGRLTQTLEIKSGTPNQMVPQRVSIDP